MYSVRVLHPSIRVAMLFDSDDFVYELAQAQVIGVWTTWEIKSANYSERIVDEIFLEPLDGNKSIGVDIRLWIERRQNRMQILILWFIVYRGIYTIVKVIGIPDDKFRIQNAIFDDTIVPNGTLDIITLEIMKEFLARFFGFVGKVDLKIRGQLLEKQTVVLVHVWRKE